MMKFILIPTAIMLGAVLMIEMQPNEFAELGLSPEYESAVRYTADFLQTKTRSEVDISSCSVFANRRYEPMGPHGEPAATNSEEMDWLVVAGMLKDRRMFSCTVHVDQKKAGHTMARVVIAGSHVFPRQIPRTMIAPGEPPEFGRRVIEDCMDPREPFGGGMTGRRDSQASRSNEHFSGSPIPAASPRSCVLSCKSRRCNQASDLTRRLFEMRSECG